MLATWGANQGFSPSSLFSAGEQGTWYDPSDLTTLFQDAAGTAPVTDVEQPVGLMLDKSKGLTLGPELVTNGTFDTDLSGWTSSALNPAYFSAAFSSGKAQLSIITNTTAQFSQALSVISGKTYKITASVKYISGTVNGSVGVRTTNSANTSSNLTSQSVNTVSDTEVSFYYLAASTTTVYVGAYCYTTTCSFSIDNISVRELPGNHAYQTTSANRPTLSARYNLLTKTEQFSNAAWIKEGNGTGVAAIVTDNYGIAPDGTQTATRIQLNKGAGTSLADRSRVIQSLSGLSNPHTEKRSIYMRSLSGTVSVQFSNGYATANTVTVTSDWQLFEQTVTVANTLSELMILIQGGVTPTNSNSCDLLVWHPDYRIANDGVGIPAYQRVNTATDYDTVGFPKYLSFNGSSSAMVTNTVTPGTDKAQVFAGVRKLSDVGLGIVVESSVSSTTNAGAIYLLAPGTVPEYYVFRSGGSTRQNIAATDAGLATPITNVLTGLGNISGDQAILRVNGAQAAISTADQGTGNYLAYPLYIGARAGTSIWFNGRIYSMILRFGSNLTTAQITNTENYVNTKTKAY